MSPGYKATSPPGCYVSVLGRSIHTLTMTNNEHFCVLATFTHLVPRPFCPSICHLMWRKPGKTGHVQWRTRMFGGWVEVWHVPSVQLWSGFLNPRNIPKTAWCRVLSCSIVRDCDWQCTHLHMSTQRQGTSLTFLACPSLIPSSAQTWPCLIQPLGKPLSLPVYSLPPLPIPRLFVMWRKACTHDTVPSLMSHLPDMKIAMPQNSRHLCSSQCVSWGTKI